MSAFAQNSTVTGGRQATTRHIPPKLALAVGMPSMPPPRGWQWSELTRVARLESGHTPSRKHPEYWGGTIPWIGIKDARVNHGTRIDDTEEKTNELGIKNSSARVLPANTVCLSRTASVGYVVVMGRPMATSQDFVNWVCSEALDHNFLKYLLIAEGEDLLRFASGSVHQTIYFPEVKAFHICHPSLTHQRRIVSLLDAAFDGMATAKANTERSLRRAGTLFRCTLESLVSRRDDEWVETTLGAEIDLLAGFAFKSAGYTKAQDAVRLLRGDNVIPGGLRWDEAMKWTASDTAEHNRYQLREHDVVLAMDRPWVKAGLKHAMISASDLPCLLVQRTARMRPGHRMTARFLLYLIGTAAFARHILGSQTGIGVPHISSEQIKSFAFAMPPLREQRHIAEQLDSLQEETKRLESLYERKLVALAAFTKSLLFQAFSGRI